MRTGWNADEVESLKKLRLDPVRNSPEKLLALVRHFKGPKPGVWAVTEGASEVRVSTYLARKVRDLTSEGKLDWLLQDQGLTPSGSGGGGGTVAKAASLTWARQMQQSGDWLDLCKTLTTLSEQLEAPVQQLLALSEMDVWNQSLVIDSLDGQTSVGLKIEDDQLFRALKEHFPAHSAWELLEEWKAKIEQIHGQLPALCQWVAERPGIPALPQADPDGSVLDNPGITARFAQTVVSNALETVYHGESIDDFYRHSVQREYEMSSSGGLWSLTWALVGVHYVIATWGNRDELEILKRRHIEFREEIRDLPEMQAVVNSYRQLTLCRDDLRKELEKIRHFEIFQG